MDHDTQARPHRPALAQALRLDVGTRWTMWRDGYVARCELAWLPDTWEVRVLIDGDMLLAQQCATQAAVLAVADGWRRRLVQRGWAAAAATAAAAGTTAAAGGVGIINRGVVAEPRVRVRRQRSVKTRQ